MIKCRFENLLGVAKLSFPKLNSTHIMRLKYLILHISGIHFLSKITSYTISIIIQYSTFYEITFACLYFNKLYVLILSSA
jgi:hypothetical protein